MANRYFSPVAALNKEVKILAGHFDTNNTSDPTLTAGLGLEVKRTGVGTFSVKPISYDKGSVKYDKYYAYLAFLVGGEVAVTGTWNASTNTGTITLTGGADTTGEEIHFMIIAQNSTTPSV